MSISKAQLKTLLSIFSGSRPARCEPTAQSLVRLGLIAYDWDRPALTTEGLDALKAAQAAT